MSYDFFIKTFESKSNEALEDIVRNDIKYVLEARSAALDLLKQRNDKLENEKFEKYDLKIKQDFAQIKSEENKLFYFLDQIQNKKTNKYSLENGNEFQIKRLNQNEFRLRIRHSKDFMLPVVICKIIENREVRYFPYFNMINIYFVLIFTVGLFIYSYIEYQTITDMFIFLAITFFLFNVGFQIIFMTLIYKNYLNILKGIVAQNKNPNIK